MNAYAGVLLRRWITGLLILGGVLAVMGGWRAAQAQRLDSFYPRPLTAYTLYATGTSFTSPVSIGQRSTVSASAGGFALIRLVSPLSFFFNFDASNPAGISANASSYFLPANTVGMFRVPWGHWLAVLLPYVASGAVDGSPTGRAIIYVTEME